ncbi:MAG TPA: ActS/PrrB/RegB family redox-sensitive histidine kinase, partial [Thermohalobaculum sp.]|nr:ActS/PrrB/RegB family redox-sensitive histidine kinase [Thermohalobaculum sp.]
YLFSLEARGDWVRLRTLVFLRWIAIAGQTAAVLAAHFGMGFELPLIWCALLISASASVNIVAQFVHPTEKRLSERGTLVSLFFDLGQLVTLIAVTGGLNNPFAVLIIAPVTISATALRLQSTLWLGIAAMGAVALISVVHLPLSHAEGWVLETPELYRTGMAAALAIAVAFLSIYVRRVSVEGYAMGQALTATQIALAREQRLAAIGGVAAATAHELGTPLATIKLVARELARELEDRPELAEDVALIRREAERCGEIMADLGRGGRDDSQIRTAPVSAVVEEAAAPHRDRGKRILVRIDGAPAEAVGEAEPLIRRSPELVHGLRNVIQNAVDFAGSTVWIDVDGGVDGDGGDGGGEALRIAVGDDGPGFGADVLGRLGEPYVSTRHRGERRAGRGGASEYEGLGLGLFIARTLLERTGARISFANGSDARQRRLRDPGTPAELARPPGAVIEMVWPAAMLVAPKEEARRALGPNQRFGTAL